MSSPTLRPWLSFLAAVMALAFLAGCTRSSDPRPPAASNSAVTSGTDPLKASAPAKSSKSAKSGNSDTATAAKAGDDAKQETAILAGGCFWGMQDIIRNIPGVVSTDVGYTGGTAGVTYEDVHGGGTGNAESVRIVFDPAKLSYSDLLEKWFFRMHDPTTKNRQGNDVGSQYRSAIFVTSEAQRAAAKQVIQRVDASGVWPSPIVTEIATAGPFTRAEDYHQDYLVKNPGGYTCHYMRDFSHPQL
jgi:methionine-S-sulfoxide reductase